MKNSNKKNHTLAFAEKVKKYSRIGKKLYELADLKKVSSELNEIVQNAESYCLKEEGDWFDNLTIRRNMKELNGYMKSFKKFADEAQVLHQRLVALYEDMGNILNRYFEIEGEDETPEGEIVSGGRHKNSSRNRGVSDADEIVMESLRKNRLNEVARKVRKAENKILNQIIATDKFLNRTNVL